jgi:hypothetical protein
MERAVVHESVERVMGSLLGNLKLQQSLQQHIPPSPPQQHYGKEHVQNHPFHRFRRHLLSSTV